MTPDEQEKWFNEKIKGVGDKWKSKSVIADLLLIFGIVCVKPT